MTTKEQLKRNIDQAQNSWEIWTAIWSVFDYLQDTDDRDVKQTKWRKTWFENYIDTPIHLQTKEQAIVWAQKIVKQTKDEVDVIMNDMDRNTYEYTNLHWKLKVVDIRDIKKVLLKYL